MQGLLEASGVVLARSRMGEGSLWLTLFLKGQGLVRASAPGAESGRVRFGGGTEPFVCGVFHLHQGRSGAPCLSAVDVADDMLPLRSPSRGGGALLTAVRWSKLVTRHLPSGHPDDELLANLYWNLRLLCAPRVPPEAAGWRFLWRWLSAWGLAPDLIHCGRCGKSLEAGTPAAWTGEDLVCLNCDPKAEETQPVFPAEGLHLLRRTVAADVEGVGRAFEEDERLRSQAPLFALASRCATGLLSRAV